MRLAPARRVDEYTLAGPLTLSPPDASDFGEPIGDPGMGEPRVGDPVVTPAPDVVGDVLAALLASAALGGPFTTVARLARAADLTSLPAGLGPFTLFAPTDAAFARLPAGAVDALERDPARLARVLTFHLVPRVVPAPRRDAPVIARSVEGGELTVTVTGTTFRVNGARLVAPDIRTPAGDVHAIDGVLAPPGPRLTGGDRPIRVGDAMRDPIVAQTPRARAAPGAPPDRAKPTPARASTSTTLPLHDPGPAPRIFPGARLGHTHHSSRLDSTPLVGRRGVTQEQLMSPSKSGFGQFTARLKTQQAELARVAALNAATTTDGAVNHAADPALPVGAVAAAGASGVAAASAAR